MNKIKNIIFDLDGTLWDSRKQILNAWKKILKSEENLSLSIDDFNDLMGKTNEEYKTTIFKDYNLEKADYVLKLCQTEEVKYLEKNGGNIFDNSIITIKELSKKYNLFIVSNCQSGYIESFINYYDLNNFIKDFECSGRTAKPKDENIHFIIERNNLLNDEIKESHLDIVHNILFLNSLL